MNAENSCECSPQPMAMDAGRDAAKVTLAATEPDSVGE